ncbi:hypothetical protein ACILG0_10225 [Pseudomonadota bacterium AL_CKDN230030165-1A_HGKHYDSX7]
MSFPAGSSTPRGPFAGAAPLAHRPLSAIAATTGGGVPESRVKRVLAELLAPLASIHERGRICADITTHSVGLDEAGKAHLLAAQAQPRQHDGQLPAPTPGFAPFEFYTQTPEWPRGPWSDIYSLCAVAHSLITGMLPPPAPDRVVNDTYVPLAQRGLSRYSPDFLSAIDAGLAVRPAERPQTVEALALLLAFEPVEDDADLATIAPISVNVDAPRADYVQPVQQRPSVGAVLFVLLLIAITAGVGFYWWNRLAAVPKGVITASESMVPNTTAQARLPQGATPVPGTASSPGSAGGAAPAGDLPPEPPGLQSSPPAGRSAMSAGSSSTANGTNGTTATNGSAGAGLSENGGVARSAGQAPQGAAAGPGTALPATNGAEAGATNPDRGEVNEAETTTATPADPAPPARVLVRVNVMPWGEIWINGTRRGVSPPLKELRLLPGKYSVTVRNADLPPYQTTIDVRPGRGATITHTFR